MIEKTEKGAEIICDAKIEKRYCDICKELVARYITYHQDNNELLSDNRRIMEYDHIRLVVKNPLLDEYYVMEKDICNKCLPQFRIDIHNQMVTAGFDIIDKQIK